MSALLLSGSFFYSHWNRGSVYAHHIGETRLFLSSFVQVQNRRYSGNLFLHKHISASFQLVYALSIQPGSFYLPSWVLDAANLLLWWLFWACSGHKHLR